MAHRGRPHQDIAADLGITPRTVQRWLNAYLDGGLDGLRPRKAKGHAPADPGPPGRRGPPLGHRRAGRAGAGPGQLDPRRAGRPPAQDPGHPASRSAMQRFCRKHRHPALPADLPLPAGRPGQAGRGPGGAGRAEEKGRGRRAGPAEPGRGPVPDGADARRRRWGSRGTGRSSAPGTARTCCTSSPWSTWSRRPCTPTRWRARHGPSRRPGKSKTRRMQEAFAAHLRHVGRLYPAERAQAGGADHRQRPVAPGQADRRGAGRQPAPGVQAAAQLQPAAQRRSSGSGRCCGGGRRTTGCSTPWPT